MRYQKSRIRGSISHDLYLKICISLRSTYFVLWAPAKWTSISWHPARHPPHLDTLRSTRQQLESNSWQIWVCICKYCVPSCGHCHIDQLVSPHPLLNWPPPGLFYPSTKLCAFCRFTETSILRASQLLRRVYMIQSAWLIRSIYLMSAASLKTACSCCHHLMAGKIQQKTFKESNAQAAQRAAHLPLCTQHGFMCICAYDETSESADLHLSASLLFTADRTREFLLDCSGTSAQASLSPPRTCAISWLNLHD